ncbi:RrF2 family transcriptional regulator [Kitasatospora sp. NPDC096147]|uniref:RrF2 family transcriptional regulator n=1 Tax=Kitasatospora sp. NPDC096147 TaxID=3364093 RepID=UPI0037F690CF
MSEGVEWALHCCLNLAWVGGERALPAVKLAGYYELPPAYLNKQLQALARAGIVSSVSGPKGGFRLAREPERITLMDVVAAIEGPEPAFRCADIIARGPGAQVPGRDPERCLIDRAMGRAELAWRRELAGQTLAELMGQVEQSMPGVPGRIRRWFANA